MKQTAVEWLLDNLISEPYSEEDFKHNKECWIKAEEMEKEQMENTFVNSRKIKSECDVWNYKCYEKPKETPKDSIKIDPSKVIKTQPKVVKESFPKQEKSGDSARTKKIQH